MLETGKFHDYIKSEDSEAEETCSLLNHSVEEDWRVQFFHRLRFMLFSTAAVGALVLVTPHVEYSLLFSETCKHGCGTQSAPARACRCDTECIANGNCCSDFAKVCCLGNACWNSSVAGTTSLPETITREMAPATAAANRDPGQFMHWSLPPAEFTWSCGSYGCTGFSAVAMCQCDSDCHSRLDCCHDFEDKCAIKESKESDLGPFLAALGIGALPVQTTLVPKTDDPPCGDCRGDTPASQEDAVNVYWASCASPSNRCCSACGIWNDMDHSTPGFQIVYGYLVVPSDPVAGVESITHETALNYNYLWYEAANYANFDEEFVLMVNPSTARTQHQLHIFVRKLNSHGLVVKEKLGELVNCESPSSGIWRDVRLEEMGLERCGFARALFSTELHHVFSDVFAEAALGHLGSLWVNPESSPTLATVGITVMFMCGGQVVLAASNVNGKCSIEHSISM